jgi:hypothetical protein
MPTLKRNPPVKKTTTKRELPPAVPDAPRLRQEIVAQVPLGDNREVRIMRLQTGLTEDLVRVGINLLPGGEHMSGAVFPESYVDAVVVALRKASR